MRSKANRMSGTARRIASVAVLLSVAGGAQAQTERTTPAAPDPAPGDIIVTAEKRESAVFRTPVSITAVSGRELQARGVTRLEDVAQSTPGVAFRSSGPGQTEYEMRGLSASGGSSPTVAFYLDETPITPPSSATNGKVSISPNLFDLGRVEVLRGPQGTLYGSGSLGGAVKLVTNLPELDRLGAAVQGIVSGTDGGGVNYTGNAMLNLPLVKDVLALRLVGSHERRSGWIDRVVLDPFPLENGDARGDVLTAPAARRYANANDARIDSVRASLLFKPTPELTITPAFFYENIRNDGMDLYDSPPGRNAHYQPSDVAEPFSDRFTLGSLTVNYDFPGVQVTNALSYWSRAQRQVQDASENLQYLFDAPSFIAGANSTERETTHQLSEELRLSSTTNSAFQWLAGFFYSDFHSRYHQAVVSPGFVTDYGLPDANLFTGDNPIAIKQVAAFGQAAYAITPTFKATAGLRYYHYSSTVSGVYTGDFGYPTNPAKASNSGVNPRINLSYTPSRDTLFYANIAKGFRPGGGNSAVPIAQCGADLDAIGRTAAPEQYDPDSIWSYEGGTKSRVFGGRLMLAADGYYEKWHGVQQVISLACGFGFTANAAQAEVYGGEFEAQFKLTPALTLAGSAGYAHARLTEVAPGTGFNKGDRLQAVPDWTWSLRGEYRTPIRDALELVGRVEGSHVGDRVDATAQRNYLPGYTIADARIGVEAKSWAVHLFVDNFTNTRAQYSNSFSYSVNIPTLNRIATNQPRTFGVDVSRNF